MPQARHLSWFSVLSQKNPSQISPFPLQRTSIFYLEEIQKKLEAEEERSKSHETEVLKQLAEKWQHEKEMLQKATEENNHFIKMEEKWTHTTEANKENQEAQVAAKLEHFQQKDKHTEEVRKSKESKDPADEAEADQFVLRTDFLPSSS